MKNIYFLTLSFLILSSCKYQVDNSDPFKVADAIHKGLVENDTTILKQLFAYKMDSLNDNSKKDLEKAEKYFKENKNIKIIKIDTSTMSSLKAMFRGEEQTLKIISLYCQNKDNFSHIELWYPQDSIKKIEIKGFLFNDINDECENYNNTPYNPIRQIDFQGISWRTDNRNTTFKYGAVKIQNNTNSDINYLKFRVILERGNSEWSAETFLNQTVESNINIYKDDIVNIEIPNMTDYYAGFEINKDNLFFSGELIEIKPKPESFWCEKLKKLKVNK